MPKVSIVMPVYNGLPYINEAIQSIVAQTFTDWELLVVDDHSTDDTAQTVRHFAAKDGRIQLLENTTGIRGAGPSRNVGIEQAAGEYIAMMDADDISLPKRIELQVAFMDKHPQIAMSGCYSKAFDKRKYVHWTFTSDLMIKALIVFYPVFSTATIIFRRNTITEKYPTLKRGQDLIFCLNVTMRHRVANLAKILYLYRVTDNSFVYKPEHLLSQKSKLESLLPTRLGFTPTPEQIETHLSWERRSADVSFKQKWQWIVYIVLHAKLRWYERPIIFAAYLAYDLAKRIFLMWFGK